LKRKLSDFGVRRQTPGVPTGYRIALIIISDRELTAQLKLEHLPHACFICGPAPGHDLFDLEWSQKMKCEIMLCGKSDDCTCIPMSAFWSWSAAQ
jgi:hypothetical protein